MVTSSTQTQTNAPWSGAQPYISQVLQGGRDLWNSGYGYNAPPFSTYVPINDFTQHGASQMWGAAQGENPLAGQSQNAISGILSGDINDKYSSLYSSADNPHYAQAVQGQADQIAADVQRQFGALGRTGSAANTGALTQQIGDFREKALANQWNQNIANQSNILSGQTQGRLQAVAAAPGAYDQRFLPGRAAVQVGSIYDDVNTRALQSQLDSWNTSQEAPFKRLSAYGSIVGGQPIGSGQTTTTVKQPSNPFGALLGGAYGGASIGNSILRGGTGAGLGALFGGGAGLLSGLFG